MKRFLFTSYYGFCLILAKIGTKQEKYQKLQCVAPITKDYKLQKIIVYATWWLTKFTDMIQMYSHKSIHVKR